MPTADHKKEQAFTLWCEMAQPYWPDMGRPQLREKLWESALDFSLAPTSERAVLYEKYVCMRELKGLGK